MPLHRSRLGSFRKEDLLFLASFCILFLLAFRDFFFTNKVFYERDSTFVEIPARQLGANLLKEGNLALWTDAYGNGQPFLANPKNAVLYPTTWLYLILPFFLAFKLHYLIHAILGWLGLYALCKSYHLSRQAALVGASLFCFSGIYLSSFEFYNHIAAFCWVPWILSVMNRDRANGDYRLFSLAFLWTLMILAGAPEFVLITMILVVAQAFMNQDGCRKKLILGFASLVLACLMSAIQLLPAIDLLRQTDRRSQAELWPLELVQLVNLSFPHFFGNDRESVNGEFWGSHLFDKQYPLYYSLYVGIGALLLFLLALKRPIKRERKILLLSFLIFFLLSCGRYSPFFFVSRITPLLSSIRYPIKFFLGSIFCLSILAAFGYDDMITGNVKRGKTNKIIILCAGIGMLLYWPFKGRFLSLLNKLFVVDRNASLNELGRSIEVALVMLMVYAIAFSLFPLSRSKSRLVGWAIVALAILDPAYQNRSINPTISPSFYDKSPMLAEASLPLIIYRDEEFNAFFKEPIKDRIKLFGYFRQSLYPFTAMGDGVRYVFNRDFYRTYSSQYNRLAEAVKSLPVADQFKILRYMGCTTYIGLNPLFLKESGRELMFNGIGVSVNPIAETQAFPRLAFRSIRATAIKDKLRILSSGTFDPNYEVIVDKELYLTAPPRGAKPISIRTKKEVSGMGVYTLDTPVNAVAVFSGNYAPGWRAWVDGKKAEVIEANLFSKGIAIPAGIHEVRLKYLPRSFLIGAVISVITIIFSILALMVQRTAKAHNAH